MKQQINEFKRMQLIAGLITESEYRQSLNEEETIFADYSTNNDNSIKTKLARNLAEEIHSLDVKEGTIDSLFTGEMEQYEEGNDDFYANKEEALKAFAELPDTFTIMHNIDGNKVKISITKTGPESWKVNEMDEAEKMTEAEIINFDDLKKHQATIRKEQDYLLDITKKLGVDNKLVGDFNKSLNDLMDAIFEKNK
jgi:hypothetical protein